MNGSSPSSRRSTGGMRASSPTSSPTTRGIIDADGAVISGKDNVRNEFAAGFSEGTNYTLKATIDSIRFLTPDVAQVEGSFDAKRRPTSFRS